MVNVTGQISRLELVIAVASQMLYKKKEKIIFAIEDNWLTFNYTFIKLEEAYAASNDE